MKMEHFDQENNEDNAEWLLHILKQVQLEQFYVRIRDHLQISRISHFDYVTPDDLEKVGIILFLIHSGAVLLGRYLPSQFFRSVKA